MTRLLASVALLPVSAVRRVARLALVELCVLEMRLLVASGRIEPVECWSEYVGSEVAA